MLSRFLTFALYSLLGTSLLAQDKQIILLAGKPSHGPGDHEFNAGCLLLQKCLANVPGVQVQVHSMGWPKDESVLEHAD
ncbi:MAG: hypothetical protein EBU26_11830, partial [Verrucomicrobia bacterium]|nr:hypothetical protein [Verrucomicrobiota bacterium]